MSNRAQQWDDAKLDEIREKDALWAWVYSRYFYGGCPSLGCAANRRLSHRLMDVRASMKSMLCAIPQLITTHLLVPHTVQTDLQSSSAS